MKVMLLLLLLLLMMMMMSIPPSAVIMNVMLLLLLMMMMLIRPSAVLLWPRTDLEVLGAEDHGEHLEGRGLEVQRVHQHGEHLLRLADHVVRALPQRLEPLDLGNAQHTIAVGR
jgi:hypothetical protein